MATLREASTAAILSDSVERAVTPWRRTIGFLFARSISPERGLWFERCHSIHTIGMRSALDIIFLDDDRRVIAVAAGVLPNRPFVSHRGTATIVECGPGFLERHNVAPGQVLELR